MPNQVKIIIGEELTLRRYSPLQESVANTYQILIPPYSTEGNRIFLRHNNGLRDLLAKLRKFVGSNKFEKISLHHRVPASFLLDTLDEALSLDERRHYGSLATNLFSHTSHNWFISSFIVDAWSRLFSDLLSNDPLQLVVPDVRGTDANFVSVLSRLILSYQLPNVRFVLGFRRDEGPLELDEQGLAWRTLGQGNLRSTLMSLPDIEVCDATDVSGDDINSSFEADIWDSNADYNIAQILEQDALADGVAQDCMSILSKIFGTYDFRSALQLGLRLLKHRDELSPMDQACLYTYVAVSAHNRQFDSADGNFAFDHFLETHLRRALELESDPVRRSVVSYRLATTLARRQKRAEPALLVIDRSLDELRKFLPSSRKRAYYEAWLLNIRAYACMLTKDFRKSAQDVESAFSLAEEFWNNQDDATPGEIYSSQLFAGNRASLALFANDYSLLDSWFTRGTSLFEKHWDVGKRYVRFMRVYIEKNRHDIRSAIEAGIEGLADARREHSVEYQDLYLLTMADLYYRIGQVGHALECLGHAFALYDRINELPRRITALAFQAVLEARSGNLDAAEHVYRKVLTLASSSGRPLPIEDVQSARALLAARRGFASEAEVLLDEAIERALALGERDSLLLVARRAGDAFSSLHDLEQAGDAYRRALAIADVPSTEGLPPSQGEVARVLIGLYESIKHPLDIPRLLDAASKGLLHDSDLWWELPRILDSIRRESTPEILKDHLPEMESLIHAASQREDCQAALGQLTYRFQGLAGTLGSLLPAP